MTLDWRVLLFALSLSISAAVVFGVLPAFKGSSVDPGASLKDGVRSSSGRSRLRSAFVVGQIACSVLLVVLGASFVRVLRHAGAADPGFDARGVDIATLDLSVTGEPKAGTPAFWRMMIDRVRADAGRGERVARACAARRLGRHRPRRRRSGRSAQARRRPSRRRGTSSSPATSRRSAFP